MPKSFDELSRYMQIRAIVAYNWVKCVLKFSRVCSKGILCTLVFLLTLHIFKSAAFVIFARSFKRCARNYLFKSGFPHQSWLGTESVSWSSERLLLPLWEWQTIEPWSIKAPCKWLSCDKTLACAELRRLADMHNGKKNAKQFHSHCQNSILTPILVLVSTVTISLKKISRF